MWELAQTDLHTVTIVTETMIHSTKTRVVKFNVEGFDSGYSEEVLRKKKTEKSLLTCTSVIVH